MKRVFRVLFLGVALCMMSGVVNAQVKIAHVNTAEILDAMPDKAKAEIAAAKGTDDGSADSGNSGSQNSGSGSQNSGSGDNTGGGGDDDEPTGDTH